MPKRTCALRPIAFLENESLSIEDGGDPIDGEGYRASVHRIAGAVKKS